MDRDDRSCDDIMPSFLDTLILLLNTPLVDPEPRPVAQISLPLKTLHKTPVAEAGDSVSLFLLIISDFA